MYQVLLHIIQYMIQNDFQSIDSKEALFIGDTFSTDIVGAYRANMKSVWICSDIAKACSLDVLRIPSFNDLPELLKTL